MELLIRKMLNIGGQRSRLAAKVFGGGNVLQTLSGKNRVGKENVAFAISYLHNEGISIKCRDVGEDLSRKIYFHTDTGDVFLKRIQATSFNQTVEEEQRPIERTISSSFEVCYGKKSSLDF